MIEKLALFASAVISLLIFYQDFKERLVNIILFPFLFIFILLISSFNSTFSQLINHIIFNLSFIIFNYALLTLYFSFKNKKLINLNYNYIGWGDWLMMIAISPFFSSFNYILFYLVSITLALLISIILTYKNKSKNLTIPLAGWFGLFLFIAIIVQQMFIINFLDNYYFIDSIYP